MIPGNQLKYLRLYSPLSPFSEIRCRLVVEMNVSPPGRKARKISLRLFMGESTCSRTLSEMTRSCELLGSGISSADPCNILSDEPRYFAAERASEGTGSTPTTL